MNIQDELRQNCELAFGSYIRRDGDDVNDERPDAWAGYAELTTTNIIGTMADDPASLAAVMSHVVRVSDANMIRGLATLRPRDIPARVKRLIEAGKVLLMAKSGESAAERMLMDLQDTEAGRRLYANLAFCLVWATEDGGFGPYLYGYVKKGKTREAPATFDGFEQEEAARAAANGQPGPLDEMGDNGDEDDRYKEVD